MNIVCVVDTAEAARGYYKNKTRLTGFKDSDIYINDAILLEA